MKYKGARPKETYRSFNDEQKSMNHILRDMRRMFKLTRSQADRILAKLRAENRFTFEDFADESRVVLENCNSVT